MMRSKLRRRQTRRQTAFQGGKTQYNVLISPNDVEGMAEALIILLYSQTVLISDQFNMTTLLVHFSATQPHLVSHAPTVMHSSIDRLTHMQHLHIYPAPP